MLVQRALAERNLRADFLHNSPFVTAEGQVAQPIARRGAGTANPRQRNRDIRMTESTQRNGIKAGDKP